MPILIVVDNPALWPLNVPNVQLISARAYLTDPAYSELRATKVFNLCRSYRYQTNGYYVSLLAEARGHKPTPDVATAQDIKSQSIIRLVSDELDELIQGSLAPIQSDSFVLSVYFGRNLARRYDRLSLHLFNMLPVPLLRAHFHRSSNAKWMLQHIRPIAASEIPESHRAFVIESAVRHFTRPARPKKRHGGRHDLAILVNPEEAPPPSNKKAIQKFVKAAET
ncbi:MAG: RimK-like ATPgrasp N-terminal domain-containing protein, partial [Polyangiaceae bacterium]|nr:RimK-like ATPgrasp N-terminal domain-containing protein [Polyangiaceae bacterium]